MVPLALRSDDSSLQDQDLFPEEPFASFKLQAQPGHLRNTEPSF